MKISVDITKGKKKSNMKKEKQQVPFSKKLLRLDYIIAGLLLGVFFICEVANGIYGIHVTNELLAAGVDVSNIVVPAPFNLDIFGVLLGVWIAQLGLSSGCYYWLTRNERRTEMPMHLLDTLPEDIKSQVDMTTIITTVLTSSDS